jgi:hypothetical protein
LPQGHESSILSFIVPRSPGLYAVELLVIIAIIDTVIAWLVPTIQVARESLRRSQCSNNLRQIGLGLHNCVDSHKTLSPLCPEAGYGMGPWDLPFTPFSYRAVSKFVG